MHFEKNCCITLQGKTHCALGSYRSENHALIYVDKGNATTWKGKILGSVRITGQWVQYPPTAKHPEPYTMTAIEVTMLDGSRWYGRYSSDWNQACKLRKLKA